jgi:hypothetical protein
LQRIDARGSGTGERQHLGPTRAYETRFGPDRKLLLTAPMWVLVYAAARP